MPRVLKAGKLCLEGEVYHDDAAESLDRGEPRRSLRTEPQEAMGTRQKQFR